MSAADGATIEILLLLTEEIVVLGILSRRSNHRALQVTAFAVVYDA